MSNPICSQTAIFLETRLPPAFANIDDILTHIFKELTPLELVYTSLTCRMWKVISLPLLESLFNETCSSNCLPLPFSVSCALKAQLSCRLSSASTPTQWLEQFYVEGQKLQFLSFISRSTLWVFDDNHFLVWIDLENRESKIPVKMQIDIPHKFGTRDWEKNISTRNRPFVAKFKEQISCGLFLPDGQAITRTFSSLPPLLLMSMDNLLPGSSSDSTYAQVARLTPEGILLLEGEKTHVFIHSLGQCNPTLYCLSDDGATLFVGYADGLIQGFSKSNNELLFTYHCDNGKPITFLRHFAERLFIGQEGIFYQQITIYHIPKNEVEKILEGVNCLVFSSQEYFYSKNDSQSTIVDCDWSIFRYNIQTNQEEPLFSLKRSPFSLFSLLDSAFLWNDFLATIDCQGDLRIHDLSSKETDRRQDQVLRRFRLPVKASAMDGFLIIQEEGELEVFQIGQRQKVYASTAAQIAAAFSIGNSLIVPLSNSLVEIPATGISQILINRSYLKCYPMDGNAFAIVYGDGKIASFTVANQEETPLADLKACIVYCNGFHNNYLFCVDAEGKGYLIEYSTGRTLHIPLKLPSNMSSSGYLHKNFIVISIHIPRGDEYTNWDDITDTDIFEDSPFQSLSLPHSSPKEVGSFSTPLGENNILFFNLDTNEFQLLATEEMLSNFHSCSENLFSFPWLGNVFTIDPVKAEVRKNQDSKTLSSSLFYNRFLVSVLSNGRVHSFDTKDKKSEIFQAPVPQKFEPISLFELSDNKLLYILNEYPVILFDLALGKKEILFNGNALSHWDQKSDSLILIFQEGTAVKWDLIANKHHSIKVIDPQETLGAVSFPLGSSLPETPKENPILISWCETDCEDYVINYQLRFVYPEQNIHCEFSHGYEIVSFIQINQQLILLDKTGALYAFHQQSKETILLLRPAGREIKRRIIDFLQLNEHLLLHIEEELPYDSDGNDPPDRTWYSIDGSGRFGPAAGVYSNETHCLVVSEGYCLFHLTTRTLVDFSRPITCAFYEPIAKEIYLGISTQCSYDREEDEYDKKCKLVKFFKGNGEDWQQMVVSQTINGDLRDIYCYKKQIFMWVVESHRKCMWKCSQEKPMERFLYKFMYFYDDIGPGLLKGRIQKICYIESMAFIQVDGGLYCMRLEEESTNLPVPTMITGTCSEFMIGDDSLMIFSYDKLSFWKLSEGKS